LNFKYISKWKIYSDRLSVRIPGSAILHNRAFPQEILVGLGILEHCCHLDLNSFEGLTVVIFPKVVALKSDKFTSAFLLFAFWERLTLVLI
jgi:hypothetical protein